MLRILMVKLSSLGDVIHGMAFANRLKKERPDIVIDWVVGDEYEELVRQVASVDQLIPYRKKRWKKIWLPSVRNEIYAFFKLIRGARYDLCIDLQGLFRSGVITYLSGAIRTAGFSDGREGSRFLYKETLVTSGTHAVEKLLGALVLFGIEPGNETPDFSFTIPDNATREAEATIESSGGRDGFIAFHAGARWKTKLWPERYWSVLAEKVSAGYGLPILFTGSGGDRETVDRIIAGRGGMTNLCGSGGLLTLAALLRRASLVVSVDSGPMHMAAAFGVPLAAIFGPTSHEKTGPYSQGSAEVVRMEIECSPCLKRKCPIGHDCMEKLLPEDVWDRISPK